MKADIIVRVLQVCGFHDEANDVLLKAWDSLRSPCWAYFPSESVVRAGIEELVCQTAIALCGFKKYEDAQDVLKEAKRQLGSSEQIDEMIQRIERISGVQRGW